MTVHDLGGRGNPVLLAHGAGLHGLVWQPLARRLIARGHCIAFDARGHGDSGLSPHGTDFTWDELALDVLGVVDGLDLHRPLGVGHSSGATALLLAEEERPGLFQAIYCYEPVLVPVDPPLGRDPENWIAATTRRRRHTFDSRSAAHDHYAGKSPFATLAPAALDAYVAHGFAELADGRVQLKCQVEHEATVYETATAHSGFSALDLVLCPVVIAAGDASVAFAPAVLEAQLAPLANGRLEVFSGLGHLGPLQAPDRIAHSVVAFLGEVFP